MASRGSVSSIDHASRAVYGRLHEQYSQEHPALHQISSEMDVWPHKWNRKSELLDNPKIQRTLTSQQLAQFKQEVIDTLARMEAAKQKAFRLSNELQQGVTYATKAILPAESLIADRHFVELTDLQYKRDEIQAIYERIRDGIPSAKAEGEKILAFHVPSPVLPAKMKREEYVHVPDPIQEAPVVVPNITDEDQKSGAADNQAVHDPDFDDWVTIGLEDNQ